MILVVIDTNVLVSAMISSVGNEALIIMAINQGLVTPCFSQEMLEEYSDVLIRKKFGFAQEEVDALLDLLRRRGKHFNHLQSSQSLLIPTTTNLSLAPWQGKPTFS